MAAVIGEQPLQTAVMVYHKIMDNYRCMKKLREQGRRWNTVQVTNLTRVPSLLCRRPWGGDLFHWMHVHVISLHWKTFYFILSFISQ